MGRSAARRLRMDRRPPRRYRPSACVQHLQLTIIPVVLGFVISLVLAIWAVRRQRVYGPITAITGILYTIPSIAAFALLLPIFGLTLLTAVIPLTTYTLLILVRNNVAGLAVGPGRRPRGGRGDGLHALAAAASASSCRSPCR